MRKARSGGEVAVLLAVVGCLKEEALSNAVPLGVNYPNLVANPLPVGRAGFQAGL